jgi:hypothetical protein
MNTGTFSAAPEDAGVASATLNVGQQLGGSIGTALLNTIATSAVASYVASRFSPAIAASAQARTAFGGRSGRARLHDRLLVDSRHVRRRRYRLRGPAPPRTAGPASSGSSAQRRGTAARASTIGTATGATLRTALASWTSLGRSTRLQTEDGPACVARLPASW